MKVGDTIKVFDGRWVGFSGKIVELSGELLYFKCTQCPSEHKTFVFNCEVTRSAPTRTGHHLTKIFRP